MELCSSRASRWALSTVGALAIIASAAAPLVDAAPRAARAVAHPAAAAPAHSACGGRALLTCDEKLQIFPDQVNWTHGFVLDAELFEAPQVHVYNSTLIQFWRFETAAAAARSGLESILFTQLVDGDFENIATPITLPQPSVRRSGFVDRRAAAAFTALMQSEQAEILNLEALDASLNRATDASYIHGRQDWVAWQQAAAAQYALRVAAATGRVINAERAVTASLMRLHRPFGVGSQDLKLAHRQVASHGLAPALIAAMNRLGLTTEERQGLVRAFQAVTFNTLSFNVSQFLSESDVIAGQRSFIAALRHFAARIPPASKPPA